MVYPNRMLGQQLLDAGIVQFAPGSQLDVKKSMGFKNGNLFCVAPIVFGTASPVSYDFWAVGKDCCSGSQADFSCRRSAVWATSSCWRLLEAFDVGVRAQRGDAFSCFFTLQGRLNALNDLKCLEQEGTKLTLRMAHA